jgi:hypothetical protein
VAAGTITLQLNSIQGVTLWLDGKTITPKQTVSLNLMRGQHTLVFRVDSRTRKDLDLRCELVESAGAKGHAKFVDGR